MGATPVYESPNLLTSTERKLLPIFPLDDGCALPTSSLPLHIFAFPYRAMMNDVYSAHDKTGAERLIGVCMSDGKGGLAEIGTGLEIVDRVLKPDGRQLVSTVCRQRFKVLRVVQEEPYVVAEVEYGVEDCDVPSSESTDDLSPELQASEREVYQYLVDIVSLSKTLGIYGKSTVEIPPKLLLLSPQKHAIRKSVCSLFSFACSDFLNIENSERQVLLQAPTLEFRLRRLRRNLQPSRDALLQRMAEKEAREAFGDGDGDGPAAAAA